MRPATSTSTRASSASPRQEDRQPGRPDRVPPVLRRREGKPGKRHHVLRVPRGDGAARARAWCTGSSGASRTRRHWTSGRLVFARMARRSADARPAHLLRSGRTESRARRRRDRDAPLLADHPEVPAEVALQGFDGVRAYALEPEASRQFLEGALGFEPAGADAYERRGEERGPSTPTTGRRNAEVGGAGTVHHVAWSSPMDEHEGWRQRALEGGASATPVIDRYYFRSIYFREPSGVLFEIATMGPDSPPTSRSRPSVSDCRSRRTTSTCATGSSRS